MKDKPENFRFQEPFLNGVQKNGHYLPIFSHPKDFLIFARRVLGWSIIPLWGATRPSQAKLPALPRWRAYQQYPPSDDELQAWFDTPSMQAFGVVTGQVSRLLVIDLDCPQQAADFQAAFPQLLDTLTISSGQRGLPHYYFRLPEGLIVKGLHGSGVDLRAEGQYVVAPLTSVGEHTWSITHARMPRLITEADAAALTEFVRRQTKPAASMTPLSARMSPIGDNSLADRYFALAPKMGRNNALFNTACFGRDQGWPERDVCRQLVTIHALHPPVGTHPPETPQQRHNEAIVTITSAYSQPARSCD
ncbi:bifunctional DNA primase/polymerase [bacterium]|nr:bifunctional DNA primase/polymerase [bacterium]